MEDYQVAHDLVVGISRQLECTDKFHEKMELVRRVEFDSITDETARRLHYVAQALLDLSKDLQQHVADVHMCRAHLLIEELGEHLMAYALADEVQAFDGLIDLDYVLKGTASIFDWPMGSGFIEVHDSNMSKEKQPKHIDDSNERVRVKGPNYKAPDLQKVLSDYRSSSVT